MLVGYIPENNVVLTLGQRRRRWNNVELHWFNISMCRACWDNSSDTVYWYSNATVSTLMTRLPNAGLMLAHRLRRWPNIKPALGKGLSFRGVYWEVWWHGMTRAGDVSRHNIHVSVRQINVCLRGLCWESCWYYHRLGKWWVEHRRARQSTAEHAEHSRARQSIAEHGRA